MPERSTRTHPTDKPWITPCIKAHIKERQLAYTAGNKLKYDALCVKVKNLITTAKYNYYQDKAKNNKYHNPAKWYRSIYNLVGAGNSQSTLSAPTKEELQELSEKLQTAFTAPWKDLSSTASVDISEVENLLKDQNPPIPSVGQVKSALAHLNSKKATGSDGIPAWFLKRFSEELAVVVHDIFKASIIQCKYPKAYKHALISPVPKINPPEDISNDFRQISVLPQLGKVLERLQLKLHTKDIQCNTTQHAFTANRSTVSALINITQSWFDATDNNKTNGQKGVHALFIDFKKAFDMVDHKTLLMKLAEHHINKSFWQWIKSFLSQRTQQVKIQNILSTYSSCPAGVPQGSVISPVLFNVIINDLEDAVPNHLPISTNKYADDCTEHELISLNSQGNMQEVVDEVVKWTSNNKMELNSKKTKDMWICFSNKIPEPPPLFCGTETIERVETFKLLGVWQQNNLKWNTHVHQTVRKACKKLFHLRECRRSNLPVEIGLTTYISKIRPILEYASPVWGGLPKYLEDEIEQIQTRSMKIIGLPKNHLPTLRERRVEATKGELLKIQSDTNHPCRVFLPSPKIHNYNLRSKPKFNKTVSNTDRHKNSFIPRACSLTD